MKLNLCKIYHTTYKIFSCCDIFKNEFELVNLCQRELYLAVFYLNKKFVEQRPTGNEMVRRYISKYKIMVINTFPHQNKQKILGKVIPVFQGLF